VLIALLFFHFLPSFQANTPLILLLSSKTLSCSRIFKLNDPKQCISLCIGRIKKIFEIIHNENSNPEPSLSCRIIHGVGIDGVSMEMLIEHFYDGFGDQKLLLLHDTF